MRRIVASTLIGVTLMGVIQSTIQFAHASGNAGGAESNSVVIITSNKADTIVAPGIEDLGVQLNDLYSEVGKNLNIDYLYVKILHLIAGGKAVYADKRPNIYGELTVESLSAPFEIEGAVQNYTAEAPWAICPDETIERPSKYYLPDAAYSVTSEVIKLMNKRYFVDRGSMQEYFDSLGKDVKTNVVFCEAVLEYIGASEKSINSFYPSYEKVRYMKDKYENVIEVNSQGVFTIKSPFKEVFIANNIVDERELDIISLILSFDSALAASSNPNGVKSDLDVPYIKNYTSRENMMIAAISIIGKVRYVWGGGHLGSGGIDGINPMWQAFFNQYGDESGEPGYGMCIKPRASWCPMHGQSSRENGCLFSSETNKSATEYILNRGDILPLIDSDLADYSAFLSESIDFTHGVVGHRLDGLDCSGYTSWLYNQITDQRVYDSGATAFISSGGLKRVPWGNKMLPGDVFSWGEHIVVIIGQVKNESKAYVMAEASPNMVKFGVVYYGGAHQSDINLARQIAIEANKLIGNLPDSEKTHVYNMSNLGYNRNSSGEVVSRYAEIGRLKQVFLDEESIITGYNKRIQDMTAQEIIQHTINSLDLYYLKGAEEYNGEIFKLPDTVLDKIEEYRIEQIMREKEESLVVDVEVNVIVDNGVETLINELSNTEVIILSGERADTGLDMTKAAISYSKNTKPSMD